MSNGPDTDTLEFQCPGCGAKLNVPSSLAGITGPCPFCEEEITAPAPIGADDGNQTERRHPSPPGEVVPRSNIDSFAPTHIPETIVRAPMAESPAPTQQSPIHTTPKNPAKTTFPESLPPPTTDVPLQTHEGADNADDKNKTPRKRRSRPPRRKPSKSSRRLALPIVILVLGALGGYYWFFILPNKDNSLAAPPPSSSGPPEELIQVPPPPSEADDHPGPADATSEAPPATPDPPLDESATTATDDSLIKLEPDSRMPLDPDDATLPPPGAIPADAAVATAMTPPGSAPDATNGIEPDSELLEAPRTSLRGFLSALNWKERGKWIQNPTAVLSKMEAYYQNNPGASDGPVASTSVTFQSSDKVPGGEYSFFLFLVTTKNVPEGFPVSVEETADGFRVDWEAFIEFNDHLLHKFMTNFQSEPRDFRVIMRRTHYFGTDIPNLKNKYAFRIDPPVPGYEGYAFVDRDAPLVADKLTPNLDWSVIAYPVVRLEWSEDEGKKFVRIQDLVQPTWRTDGAVAPSP